MKTYSIIVLNVTLANIGVCLSDFILQQRMIPSGFKLYYISYGPCAKVGPETCFAMYASMLHFHSHSLWLLFLAFAYRYYVMIRKEPSRWALQFTICIFYIPSFIMMIALILEHSDPEYVRQMLTQQFLSYNITGLIVTGSMDILNFSSTFAIIHMTILSTPIFIGMLIFRRLIIKHLTFEGVDLTYKTRNLHAQLLRALTFQATIPIFYILGVACFFISQFGVWNHPFVEFSIFTFLLMFPILTPLSSLIYVTPYKKYVKKLWSCEVENEVSSRRKSQRNSIMTVAS